ncbi:unnamed protein product [Lactuca saligna]|uniref:MBD domain-containing protein n=1 Tax=Lactuca saligna TaxID=75948 RepID=A0AA36EMI4_LACSI|nr:unnamed protein product [Lactuca saligna]
MRVTISKHMEEPITDGDDYAHHRQLVLVDVVNPISHSISSSSSITPFSPNSPNDGSALQTVPSSCSDDNRSNPATPNMIGTSKFTLPKDWSVQKVHRKYGGTTDKYYRDPESGRQFRSLKEVERYITEGVTPNKSRLKKPNNHREKNSGSQNMIIVADEKVACQDMIVANEKMSDVEEDKDKQYDLGIVSPTSVSPFQLPYGWVVKEVPRSSGDYADKYYFEPGTGQRFRSLVAVQKHLTEVEENSPLSVALEEIRENSLPISKAFKLSTTIKNHGSYSSWKKSMISRREKTSPPNKINWVIDQGSGGDDTWNAFMDDTLVQDSVKKQWSDSFMVAITNGNDK